MRSKEHCLPAYYESSCVRHAVEKGEKKPRWTRLLLCLYLQQWSNCVLTFTVWLFGRRCERARDACQWKDGYCWPEPWTDLRPPGRRVRVKSVACFVCSKKIPSGRGKRKKLYRTSVQQASPWQRSHRWLKEPKASVQTVAAPQRTFDFSVEKTRTCKAAARARVRWYYLELFLSSLPGRQEQPIFGKQAPLGSLQCGKWVETGVKDNDRNTRELFTTEDKQRNPSGTSFFVVTSTSPMPFGFHGSCM